MRSVTVNVVPQGEINKFRTADLSFRKRARSTTGGMDDGKEGRMLKGGRKRRRHGEAEGGRGLIGGRRLMGG